MWFAKKTTVFDFYLAGGMRGYENLNKAMFNLVAGSLRKDGFTVWSPSEQTSYLHSSFADCMTLDLNNVINTCGKIAFLPRWRESLGANMEAFAAFACGKEGVEIRPSEDNTNYAMLHVDLSQYRMPYKDGETVQFNPHKCKIDSFEETDDA